MTDPRRSPVRGIAWTAAILILAAVLRLWALDNKPPHFDEGINGWFADRMKTTGYYDYDPSNYHGPLHFYAVYVSQALFGRNLWALRLPAVAASLLAVWMLLRCDRFVGAPAARIAALAMAVSPAYVFYGRYSIHESWLVFFNILMVWGLLALWKDGRRRGLFAVIAGIAGMVLTKETYVIQAGCALLAFPFLWLWERAVPSRPATEWAGQRWAWRDLVIAAGVAVVVVIVFYSGTFLNWQGVAGLWQTFAKWIATGLETGGHEKTAYDLWWFNWYWIALMARYEWPALAGLLLCAATLAPAPRMLRWLAVYGGGLLLAYSIIPYKTPWCVIALLWPFLLVLGAVATSVPGRWRAAAWIGAGALIAVSLGLSLRLNFQRFTDPREPYVYVQTFRVMDVFTGPLLELAARDPRNHHLLRGEILAGSYFPLPWVLGDFTAIAWRGADGWPEVIESDFVLADADHAADVESRLRGPYFSTRFRLREAQPECIAYFRSPTFAEFFPGEQPRRLE